MTEDWRDCDRRRRAKPLVRLLRTKSYFHENISEFRFSEKLRKRVGEVAWEYVPQARELVVTDVGEGLVVDLIRNHDGSIVITLAEYLARNGMTPECREAIDRMWAGLEEHRIFVQGRPDNLVVQEKEDGSCQCYAIDGFGLPYLIPLAQWFRPFTRKRFRRCISKHEKAVARILEQREKGEEVWTKGFRLDQEG